MKSNKPNEIELMEEVYALEKELRALGAFLETCPDIEVLYLSSIAQRPAKSVDLSADIAPLSVVDCEKKSVLIKALTNVWLEPGQSPAEALRWPGVVKVGGEAIEKIIKINSMKDAINESVPKLTDNPRTPFWKRFPGISSLQLLRRINVVQGARRVRFYWCQTSSVSKRSCGELIKYTVGGLDFNLKINGRDKESDRKVKSIILSNQLQALLEIDSSEVLATVRMGTPVVKVRVTTSADSFYRTGSLPLIMSHSCADPEIVELKNLYSYLAPVKARRGKHVRDKLETLPISEGSIIYRYMPAWREMP